MSNLLKIKFNRENFGIAMPISESLNNDLAISKFDFTNKKIIKRYNRKNGAILLLTALLASLILGITAIVIDIGYLYYKKNDLQTAVNAAWLAGNDRLMKLKSINPVLSDKDRESIKEHIVEVMKYNGFTEDKSNKITVTIKDNKDLQIVSRSHVGLLFAKAIEINSTTVAADRESHATNSGISDILPIVIPHGITKWNDNNTLSFQFFSKDSGFIPGNEYIIKPGQISESSILCQGITNFTVTEAINSSEYLKHMNYGFTKALNINDKISLSCNGFPIETQNSLTKRFNDNNIRVIIPIGEISEESSNFYGYKADSFPIYNIKSNLENPINNANSVKITGFAEFELIKESDYQRIGDDYRNGDEGTLGKPTKGQIRGIFIGYLVKPNTI